LQSSRAVEAHADAAPVVAGKVKKNELVFARKIHLPHAARSIVAQAEVSLVVEIGLVERIRLDAVQAGLPGADEGVDFLCFFRRNIRGSPGFQALQFGHRLR
jgi:hypothetical protein